MPYVAGAMKKVPSLMRVRTGTYTLQIVKLKFNSMINLNLSSEWIGIPLC